MKHNLAKLDSYDYILLPGVVRIPIDSSSDPILVDVMSEISSSNNLFYIEGRYYHFIGDYEIRALSDSNSEDRYLELSVVEVRGDLIPDILNSLGDENIE